MARWRAVGGGGSELIRARVTTFSLTPHHPKVVALPKVPFPLPDIIVDRLQVCWRAVTAQGIAWPSSNAESESDRLVPTAAGRSINDVVSSTMARRAREY